MRGERNCCERRPRHRPVPQPAGFEGFGVVEVLLLMHDLSVTHCGHPRVLMTHRDTAGQPMRRHVPEHDEPVAKIVELHRLRTGIGAPGLEKTRHELSVARRAAIALLHKSRLYQLARWSELPIGRAAELKRVQIATVPCLQRSPGSSPNNGLADTRIGLQPADHATVGIG